MSGPERHHGGGAGTASASRAPRSLGLVLAVVCVGQFMVVLDETMSPVMR